MIGIPASVYREVLGDERARAALAHLRSQGPAPYSVVRDALRTALDIHDEQFERLVHRLEDEALVGRRASKPTPEERKQHRYRVLLELTALGEYVADLIPRLDEVASQVAREHQFEPVGWPRA